MNVVGKGTPGRTVLTDYEMRQELRFGEMRISPQLGAVVFCRVQWVLICVLIGLASSFVGANWAIAQLASDVSNERLEKLIAYLADPPENAEELIFVPPPREQLRPLLQAARAISKKDYVRGSSLLSELLNDDEFEDFLIPDPDDSTRAVSMRSLASSLLLSVPWDQLDSYRLRYGTLAKQALDEAVGEGDFEAIALIGRKYFLTPAGWEASFLLGHEQLQRGRPLAAAGCFQRILDYEPARREHDPHASIMLAISWLLAGNDMRAESTLRQLVARLSEPTRAQPIQFLDQMITLPRDGQNALSWLRNLVGRAPLESNRAVQQWMLVRGNAQRNAASDAGLPLPLPVWSLPTNVDPEMARVVRNRQHQLLLGGAATIPSIHPLAVGDVIVMRTFDQMFGVDLRTGKRVWAFPPNFVGSLASRNTATAKRLRQDVNSGSFEQRYWRDSVYGQVSSDGRLVYVVPQPGFVGEATQQLILPGGLTVPNPLGRRTCNELIAVDLSREGAIKWEVGGKDGLDEPALKEAFFLGAPLPLEGRLYAICHQSGVIRLAVLEAESGRLIWTQQLASTAKFESFAELDASRLAGASPSYSDGILICPTTIGALVAIDVASQSAIWAKRYGSGEAIAFLPAAHSTDNLIDGLWRDSTITIDKGLVIYSPVDSQELVCLDLLTGEPIFNNAAQVTISRGDSLYVGCIELGEIVLVGTKMVRAISCEDGRLVWSLPLNQYGQPSGRGFFGSGRYFLPTTSSLVIDIDLAQGQVVDSVRTDRVLGNLIGYRGFVISQGTDHLAAYPQTESSWRLVEASEKSGTLTPELNCLKALLLMQKGKLLESLRASASAVREDPNPTHSHVFAKAAIRAARESPDESLEIVGPDAATDLGDQYPAFRAAVIDGLIANRQLDRVLKVLIEEVNRLVAQNDSDWARIELVPATPELYPATMRMDCFVSSRLEQARAAGGSAGLAVCDHAIQACFEAHADQSTASRIRLARLLGFESLSLDQLERLAETSAAEGFRLAADEIWTWLCEAPDKQVCTRAKLKLAEQLVAAKFPTPAQRLALDVLENHAKAPAADDAAAAESAKRLLQTISNATAIPSINWGTGRGKIETVRNWRAKSNLDQSIQFPLERIEFPLIDDDLSSSTRVYHDGWRDCFIFLNGTGQQLWQCKTHARDSEQPDEEPFGGAHTALTLAAVNRHGCLSQFNKLAGFDLYRLSQNESPILWSTELGAIPDQSSAFDSAQIAWGMPQVNSYDGRIEQSAPLTVWPSHRGIALVENENLICFDFYSGEKVWEQPLGNPDSQCFADDSNIAIWNPHLRSVVVFDLKSKKFVASYVIPTEWGLIWRVVGCRVAFSAAASDSQTIRFVDLKDSSLIWERKFPFKSRGNFIDAKTLAICDPTGRVQILDLLTGNSLVEAHLPLDQMTIKQLHDFRVERIIDSYLVRVQTITPEEQARYRGDLHRDGNRVELMELNTAGNLMFGYLWAFDATSGNPRWPKPMKIEHFQLLDVHGPEIPIAIVGRRIDVQRENDTDYSIQFVAIDLRFGREIGRIRIPYVQCDSVFTVADPGEQQIAIVLSDLALQIQMTNDPGPPRYASELTLQNTMPAELAPTFAGTVQPNATPNLEAVLPELYQEQADLEKLRMEFERELQKRRDQNGDKK